MDAPWVRTLIRRETLPSTSDEARRRLVEGVDALPLVVRADRQTAGRGRGSNRWWSDGGSLTFTIGLAPAVLGLAPRHEPAVALASAVAVIEAVEGLSRGVPVPLGIRWPNDVEAGGKKLGGILPERVETPGGAFLAVGIGVNVATLLEGAPPEVRRMATSLAALGVPATADDLFARLCDGLRRALGALAADDPALAARWAALDALRGRPVRVDQGGTIVAGTGRGIDAEGALRLETPGGIAVIRGGRVLRPSP